MAEIKEGSGGLSRRLLMKRGAGLAANIALGLALGPLAAGCSGGGSSGGGGGSTPVTPPTSTVTVGATTRAQGPVQTDPQWVGLYGALYTEVGPSSQKLTGDLNYENFQALEADKANVTVGVDTVTWREVNGGTKSFSFLAT